MPENQHDSERPRLTPPAQPPPPAAGTPGNPLRLTDPRMMRALAHPDGTFLGIPDAWWQRAGVAAEVDSREYHISPENQERTRKRHNRRLQGGR
jgi:hypothetical protein